MKWLLAVCALLLASCVQAEILNATVELVSAQTGTVTDCGVLVNAKFRMFTDTDITPSDSFTISGLTETDSPSWTAIRNLSDTTTTTWNNVQTGVTATSCTTPGFGSTCLTIDKLVFNSSTGTLIFSNYGLFTEQALSLSSAPTIDANSFFEFTLRFRQPPKARVQALSVTVQRQGGSLVSVTVLNSSFLNPTFPCGNTISNIDLESSSATVGANTTLKLTFTPPFALAAGESIVIANLTGSTQADATPVVNHTIAFQFSVTACQSTTCNFEIGWGAFNVDGADDIFTSQFDSNAGTLTLTVGAGKFLPAYACSEVNNPCPTTAKTSSINVTLEIVVSNPSAPTAVTPVLLFGPDAENVSTTPTNAANFPAFFAVNGDCPGGQNYPGFTVPTCTNCAQGKYAGGSAIRSSCTDCTAGKSTAASGANASSLCLDVCPIGTFSSTTVVPCEGCAKGTYTASTGTMTCTTCASGKTTAATNSTSSTACQDACPVGQFNTTNFGILPCSNCSAGFYAPSNATVTCLTCAAQTEEGASTCPSPASSLMVNWFVFCVILLASTLGLLR